MNTLSSFATTNEFIRDLYVYFREQEVVVTPEVKSDANTFYQLFYKYDAISEAK
jgi:two-component system response regulator YesN